ncbi:MAG: PIN domain-containing protein [Candidatus Diapherotrites archaeon]
MEPFSKVALDTNILLYSVEKRFDILNELRTNFGVSEIVVPQSVVNEIRKILKKSGNGKLARKAALAEKIIEIGGVKIVKLSKNADNDLKKLSKRGFAIATHDRELKKLIKNYGGKVIYLGSKKNLEVI